MTHLNMYRLTWSHCQKPEIWVLRTKVAINSATWITACSETFDRKRSLAFVWKNVETPCGHLIHKISLRTSEDTYKTKVAVCSADISSNCFIMIYKVLMLFWWFKLVAGVSRCSTDQNTPYLKLSKWPKCPRRVANCSADRIFDIFWMFYWVSEIFKGFELNAGVIRWSIDQNIL